MKFPHSHSQATSQSTDISTHASNAGLAQKQLPPRPSLEHLKKQAKQLLNSGHPELSADAQLSDAQYTLAKSYGFSSWPELKNAVDEQQPLSRALRDLAAGKLCILFDDKDRENEGDFVAAAQSITAEQINFMTKHGRGTLCIALSPERAKALGLKLAAKSPGSLDTANFGPSIDLASHRTGVSASDRADTIKALMADDAKPEDFKSPGHVFTLIGSEGGLSVRQGHTEGSLELMKRAGLQDGAVVCEIMAEDGSMARFSDLEAAATEHAMALVTTSDLLSHKPS